jgi:hypothetical protein
VGELNHEQYPFNTDNRAWRRLPTALGEHLDLITWHRDGDGRPTLVSLIDLGSGDIVSLAVLDSHEMREPRILLAFTVDGDLSGHGPFNGEPAAASFAAQLALQHVDIAAARPITLHHPDQPNLPDSAWAPVPPSLADAARPATAESRAVALVLLDRTRRLLTAVGPFPRTTTTTTTEWQPVSSLDPTVDRLTVPLHPAPPADA